MVRSWANWFAVPSQPGFVLPGAPDHGYMFCTGAVKKNYADAKNACEDQGMHLAWLETSAENSAVAQKLEALSNDAEVLFGARRLEREAWKTSSLRDRTIRLVKGGLALMRTGYRKLLRGG